ncbi:3-hydroxybutyrate dehydrogenase [Planctobacterium marinum]|uniref:3-hydroxybutyrate dehydrogenase n=1 Tax=Planctobacterium marinum TaxID=1631968 RepID=UPI001E31CBC9|nr:3-hydroxybutyrate dehydrogenase [Planctobacterium marinum]MCC2604826.1 3-hydroxybutyrate dehydrogenase [Planctobacterium marinum]
MKHRVLITGAASGIGLGVARLLGEEHQLILTDLNADALQQAQSVLREEGIEAQTFVLNVTSQQDIDAMVEQLDAPVDVLINNAGIQHVSPLESFPMDRWQLIVDILLTGPARLTRALLPGMRNQAFGRIINIGSIHGLVASPYKSAYVAAKHGLAGFSKVLALETADTDITINTICPAYVKTPLVEKQIADQAQAHGISEEEVINNIMLEPMPKKAFIDIAEIAHTAKFLMAKEARNMTGQSLVLDGGWTVR